MRQRSDSSERNVPKFQTSTATHYNKFKKKLDKKYLEVGQGVMCIHNREMAVVKYVGHTDFAPGIWVGLEIKNPKGRHFSDHETTYSDMLLMQANIMEL